MQWLPIDAVNLSAIFDRGPLRQTRLGAAAWINDNAYLLQRTQRAADDEPADARYWTPYDYFMLEREARAMRRAHLSGLIAGAWRRLRELPSRLNRN